jgi:hypothetical protein
MRAYRQAELVQKDAVFDSLGIPLMLWVQLRQRFVQIADRPFLLFACVREENMGPHLQWWCPEHTCRKRGQRCDDGYNVGVMRCIANIKTKYREIRKPISLKLQNSCAWSYFLQSQCE